MHHVEFSLCIAPAFLAAESFIASNNCSGGACRLFRDFPMELADQLNSQACAGVMTSFEFVRRKHT